MIELEDLVVKDEKYFVGNLVNVETEDKQWLDKEETISLLKIVNELWG